MNLQYSDSLVFDPKISMAEPNSLQLVSSKKSNSQQKLAHEVIGTFNGNVVIKPQLPPELQPLPGPLPAKEIEEDNYVAGLSKIIQRDFFPDLEKLRVQKELYDAVDQVDDSRAAQLAFQLAKMTETGDFGNKNDGNGEEKEEGNHEYDTNMNLDRFQAKYTSEDNASFNELVQKENEKKKEKYAHFYPSEQRLLEVTSKKMIEGVSRPINTWDHTAKSSLMYGPEGVPLTLADLPPSRAGPKKVIHSNTRLLSTQTVHGVSRPPEDIMESMEKSHAEQLWRNMAATVPSLYATGSNSIPLGGARDNRGQVIGREPTPMINGYKILPDTPDIRPHDDVDPSALITWGMVESTPLLVDSMGKSGGGPSFSIAPTPKREALAKELGEKASQSLRKRNVVMNPGSATVTASVRALSRPTTLAGRTPVGATPGSNGVFKKPLARHQSPAVEALKKKLAGKVVGKTALGGALQSAYSSTPTSNGANPTPTRSWTGVQSVQAFPIPNGREFVGSTSSVATDRSKITENLLNLKP